MTVEEFKKIRPEYANVEGDQLCFLTFDLLLSVAATELQSLK